MTDTTTAITEPVPDMDAAHLQALLDAQREAFVAEGVPSAAVRRDRIERLTLVLLEHADELTAALSEDFGNRPVPVSLNSDVLGTLGTVHHILDNLEDWMTPVEVPGTREKGMPTVISPKPKGVVGVIGPWNFPVSLVFQPAVEALAAGNRVMIKFSEIPARTAKVFADAVAAEFDPTEVVVVLGGPATAAQFSSLQFDHLFFTGSPAVGRKVGAAAGANLVPVTLELGGKNPVVVATDADISETAERITGQRMLNGGQVCLCPDYVFVPTSRRNDFVAAFQESVKTHYPTYAANPDVVSIVNGANYRRVVGLIDDARSKNATVIEVVNDDDAAQLPDPAARRIAPTLLLDVTEDMDIASEEVFGPVLTVYTYDDVTDAIDYIGAHPHPLAAYWYGADSEEYQKFLARTTSGGVTRGDMALHFTIEGAPFGGVGQSGMGAYHGRSGFDTFTHFRTVTGSELPFGIAPRSLPPFAGPFEDAVRDRLNTELAAFRELRASPKQ